MQEVVQPALSAWESYYVIVGSSGAALTGLQFVVIALINDSRFRSSTKAIDAFASPTVVHFCVALFVAALLSAPWSTLGGVALALGACGIAGIAYVAIVARRTARQESYQPVLEDWVWHVLLPFAAYVMILGASFALVSHTVVALFPVGAAALLLLFIGIHNAWDTVTFLTVTGLTSASQPAEVPPSSEGQGRTAVTAHQS